MQAHKWWELLLSVIGSGRSSVWVEKMSPVSNQLERHGLQMVNGCFGGEGLLIRSRVAHQPLTLWVNEGEWCELAGVVLANLGFDSIPVEMRSVIATWMLVPFARMAETHGVAGPVESSVERSACDRQSGTVFRLFSHECEVELGVIDAPVEWLVSLANALTVIEDPEDLSTRIGVIAAGWATLRREQLSDLKPGSALVLGVDSKVEAAEAWLVVDRSALLVRRAVGGSKWEILGPQIEVNEGTNVDKAIDEGDKGLKTVRLTAEIGRGILPAGALRRANGEASLNMAYEGKGVVALTADHETVAIGELMRMGSKLGVRIR
jgi:hypothetical protein